MIRWLLLDAHLLTHAVSNYLLGVIPLVTSGKKSIIHQTLDDITAEAKTVLHIDLEGSSDGEDSESDLSFESQSDDGWDDILEDLATDVQCLIDLDSLIQCPAPEIKERRGGRGKAKVAPDWEPYRPYSDMIAHRFPEAAVSLVDRLARANWERFQRTNAVREENIAAAAAGQAQATAAAVAAAVIVSGTRAQSSAATVSKFNDSGLGDSVRTGSTYADTVMSYRAQGQESVRVPPLPDGAKQGEPFNCIACSQQVTITNNSAWKSATPFSPMRSSLAKIINFSLDTISIATCVLGSVTMLHASMVTSSLIIGRTGSITLLSAMTCNQVGEASNARFAAKRLAMARLPFAAIYPATWKRFLSPPSQSEPTKASRMITGIAIKTDPSRVAIRSCPSRQEQKTPTSTRFGKCWKPREACSVLITPIRWPA